MMRLLSFCLCLLLISACSDAGSEDTAAPSPEERPNFLIIVADDLGWSDIGALGSEIRTPTLDALAGRGLVMTSFYVAPTCSPTRSMLMTGMDNHPAGVGSMSGIQTPNQNTRNYAAQLHEDVVTIAEALKTQGYQTMMSGKWHLAVDESQRPHNRGFDKSFALMPGGGSHFADRKSLNPTEIPEYYEDGKLVEELPADFYSSINYTDTMLGYLKGRDGDAPFLAYLAYTAPHDPLQVPDEWLDRYDGTYDVGPLATQQARLQRLQEKGIVAPDVALWQMPNFPPFLPLHAAPWPTRSDSQKAKDTRPMEIYASMVELMDQQLGRVITYLEETGELDNTYIVFFSDNGASAVAPLVYPGNTKEWVNANWDRSVENAGKAGNFTVMGREWANASNTPWRLFKGSVGDGGIRSPMIVAGPKLAKTGTTDALAHVMDIAPSVYELAGVDPSSADIFAGKLPLQGVSLLPVWQAQADSVRQSFMTELFNGRAGRDGKWKIAFVPRPQGSGQWELFDMSVDPGETTNVAADHPDVVERLKAQYEDYARLNGVIPAVPQPSQSLRALYPHPCDAACEASFVKFMEMARKGPPPPDARPGR
ncbi:MAG: sulfatase-like hydrolase/transferase [Pseudomonadota bacterium]